MFQYSVQARYFKVTNGSFQSSNRFLFVRIQKDLVQIKVSLLVHLCASRQYFVPLDPIVLNTPGPKLKSEWLLCSYKSQAESRPLRQKTVVDSIT